MLALVLFLNIFDKHCLNCDVSEFVTIMFPLYRVIHPSMKAQKFKRSFIKKITHPNTHQYVCRSNECLQKVKAL